MNQQINLPEAGCSTGDLGVGLSHFKFHQVLDVTLARLGARHLQHIPQKGIKYCKNSEVIQVTEVVHRVCLRHVHFYCCLLRSVASNNGQMYKNLIQMAKIAGLLFPTVLHKNENHSHFPSLGFSQPLSLSLFLCHAS